MAAGDLRHTYPVIKQGAMESDGVTIERGRGGDTKRRYVDFESEMTPKVSYNEQIRSKRRIGIGSSTIHVVVGLCTNLASHCFLGYKRNKLWSLYLAKLASC